MTCIGAPQSCAAATVPWSVPNPSDEGVPAEPLPAQLADIELAAGAHLGGGGVADVGVVRPHHRLGVGPVKCEQRVQGVEHVTVTQIPRLDLAVVHHAVVALGIGHQPRVLGRIQEALAVVQRVLEPALHHVAEHARDGLLAAPVPARERRAAIDGGIPLPGGETRVAPARERGGVRVHVIQVAQHGRDRGEETVEIEAVEAGPARGVPTPSAFRDRSHSTNSCTSAFRHIQVGKRRKAGSPSCTAGPWRT